MWRLCTVFRSSVRPTPQWNAGCWTSQPREKEPRWAVASSAVTAYGTRSSSIRSRCVIYSVQDTTSSADGKTCWCLRVVMFQASLGGRLRMIITGAAPASPSVLGFLRAALGCQVRTSHRNTYSYCDLPVWCSRVCSQVYEAYGQTECTAGCTFTTPGDWTSGEISSAYKTALVLHKQKETKLPMCFPALKSMNDSHRFTHSSDCFYDLNSIITPHDPLIQKHVV